MSYFGSVCRKISAANRPMKLTDTLSVGGNIGIGMFVL